MKEIHQMFEAWLEDEKDTEEEKRALADLIEILSKKYTEDELDSVKNLVFKYVIVCQKNSFTSGFIKATALWRECSV